MFFDLYIYLLLLQSNQIIYQVLPHAFIVPYVPVTPLSPFGPGLDSFISASWIALWICLLLFVRACITFPLRACWASVIKILNTYYILNIFSLKKYYLVLVGIPIREADGNEFQKKLTWKKYEAIWCLWSKFIDHAY